MKKIVIFSQNRDFFGAQIVHIPLIKELKNKYPNSHISIFSKNKITYLLKSLALVDEVIIEENKLITFYKYLKINPSITINLRKNSSFINFFISFFNFKTKIGFETFLSKKFFTVTKKHDSTIYRAQNYLNLINGHLKHKTLIIEKEITIIPGAGGDFKIWSLKNYIELATQIKKKYPQYELSFILGEKEKAFKKELLKHNFTIHYNLEINKLFKVIESSKITIANDCGPSHIAQISNNHYIILYSDEFEDATTITKEWYNNKEGSYALISSPKQHINSLLVTNVFEKVEIILDNHE